MTKSRLAYGIYDARRTVIRPAQVDGETGAKVRKVPASVRAKNPVLKLPVGENVFGNQPAPPSSNQTATGEPPDLPSHGRRAWDATGPGGTDWPQ
jgi:hypothetical protein